MATENRETAVIDYQHELTHSEKLEIGERIGELDETQDSLEREKNLAVAGFKARLADNHAEMKRLSKCLRTGIEERTGSCNVEYDYEAGLVKFVLPDSGLCVSSRDMTTEERQLNLFGGE